MSDEYWIRSDADFEDFDKTHKDDIVVIRNSENLETEFYIYSKNFHLAADLILEHLLSASASRADISQLDTWFFAIVYLYRQSLELISKAIIFKKYLGNNKEFVF